MNRNRYHKNELDQQIQNIDFNQVIYSGYTYFRSLVPSINNPQMIIDIQEDYMPNFGAIVRFKSCCKLKL